VVGLFIVFVAAVGAEAGGHFRFSLFAFPSRNEKKIAEDGGDGRE
jgi:hypothetical protein